MANIVTKDMYEKMSGLKRRLRNYIMQCRQLENRCRQLEHDLQLQMDETKRLQAMVKEEEDISAFAAPTM